ncbi:ISNCY family transposase, partial [Candidatus Roizmanbacteria bacterium CG_4_8_14_3_um_filter_36_12]
GRIDVFERLMRKEIKQKHAGKLLHISTRQIRTLLKRYKREGAAGIIH